MTDCGCDKARKDLEEYLRNEVCNTEHTEIREHSRTARPAGMRRWWRRPSPRSWRARARRRHPKSCVTRCSLDCVRCRPHSTEAGPGPSRLP